MEKSREIREKHKQIFYTWGANSYGQLTNGSFKDVLLPRPTTFQSDQQITGVTGGGGHTLVVTGDGSLWTCGSNNKGQLGLGHTENVTTLTSVTFPVGVKVRKASGGWDFSLAITEDGRLFSWGSNHFGQLGNNANEFLMRPAHVEAVRERVIDVSAGLRHSVVLTERGTVYCWGSGKKGQLGVEDENGLPFRQSSALHQVQVLSSFGRVTQIAAGSMHSAALTDAGHVYVWGCNKYGQAGIGPSDVAMVTKPRLVDTSSSSNSPIKALDSGWTHLLCLTESGEVITWGRGDYGQLGRKSHSHIPNAIPNLNQVSQISCGAEHNLAISGSTLVSWGWGEHGILGNNEDTNQLIPCVVDSLKQNTTALIGCGSGQSLAVVEEPIKL